MITPLFARVMAKFNRRQSPTNPRMPEGLLRTKDMRMISFSSPWDLSMLQAKSTATPRASSFFLSTLTAQRPLSGGRHFHLASGVQANAWRVFRVGVLHHWEKSVLWEQSTRSGDVTCAESEIACTTAWKTVAANPLAPALRRTSTCLVALSGM